MCVEVDHENEAGLRHLCRSGGRCRTCSTHSLRCSRNSTVARATRCGRNDEELVVMHCQSKISQSCYSMQF